MTPALAFVAGGLLVPLVRTIYISFWDRNSAEFVGIDNYEAMFDDPNFFNVDNWRNIFTSQLWWVGVVVILAGVLIGVIVGRTTKRAFESGPSSLLPIVAGAFLAACAVLSVLRGTLFNNIWWVIVVTMLATAFGLAVAVLADRAGGENIAKSMIFLPMAISFVGAAIIWRFMYQPRNVQDAQTGVLNAIWVGLGELSNSGWQKWLVAAVLAAIIVAVGVAGVVERQPGQQHPRRLLDRSRLGPRVSPLPPPRPRPWRLPYDGERRGRARDDRVPHRDRRSTTCG